MPESSVNIRYQAKGYSTIVIAEWSMKGLNNKEITKTRNKRFKEEPMIKEIAGVYKTFKNSFEVRTEVWSRKNDKK